jgi:hypothetical protein
MRMSLRLRRTALTAHVVASVGWLGAVTAFLALAVIGLGTDDPGTLAAMYLALDPLARFVVLPLGVAALATGIVQSLGTSWGLVRHHWVLAKLVLTLAATGLLILHLAPIGEAADTARRPGLDAAALGGLRSQLVVYAAGALAALLAATALSVFKPAGRTRWGADPSLRPPQGANAAL